MKKYLVTGGCGFIGSHLAHLLLKQGADVVILDDLSSGKKENAPVDAELLIGSITDSKSVECALNNVDGVFHLAAVPSVQKSLESWHAVHEINSSGTILLFEALTKLQKKIPLIYASSSGVYGSCSQIPIPEHAPAAPLSPYGIDKLSGEWHAKILWDLFQIPTISFRFFNVFGPRQDASSPYSGVISLFSECITNDSPIKICGDGDQMRDFIYVEDIVRAMAHAMNSPMQGSKIYNLCTGCGTRVNELANLMEKIASSPIKREYIPARKGEIYASIGDPTAAKINLQFQPEYSLEEGLRNLVLSCV